MEEEGNNSDLNGQRRSRSHASPARRCSFVGRILLVGLNTRQFSHNLVFDSGSYCRDSFDPGYVSAASDSTIARQS